MFSIQDSGALVYIISTMNITLFAIVSIAKRTLPKRYLGRSLTATFEKPCKLFDPRRSSIKWATLYKCRPISPCYRGLKLVGVNDHQTLPAHSLGQSAPKHVLER